jgi:putative ABC transport system permease protein
MQILAVKEMLDSLIQDIRYGFRILFKHPGFTAAAVLTLAVGIGANTAIFSVVQAVILRPLPFPHPEQLVMVWETDKSGAQSNMGYPTFADWRSQNHSFEAMSALADWSPTLSGAGEPQALVGARVTADFFRVLGVKPMFGRDFTEEDDRPNAPRVSIISYGLWQRSFSGDLAVLGKPVLLSGVERMVIGVMPPDFQPLLNPNNKRVDVWRPLGYAGETPPACRTCRHLRTIGRIKQGVTRTQAQSELINLQHRIENDHSSDYSSSGISLMPLQEQFSGAAGPVMYLLLGAVGFVLLIACANVANLMLARTASRKRELALRLALGAARSRILRQILSESLVLALLGGSLGVLLAMFGTRWLVSLAPGDIPRIEQVGLNPTVLVFALGLSFLTSILFGLIPALTAAQTDLQGELKRGGRGSVSVANRWLRHALVAADVALAMVLLSGAGLMLKSMARLLEVPSGLSPGNVLTMKLSWFGSEFAGSDGNARVLTTQGQTLDRIATLPGVKSAGLVSQLPLGGDFDMYGVLVKDKPIANPEDAPGAFRYGVTPGYLEAMGIPLRRGRTITGQDGEEAQPVIVINELFANRMWPGEDPLGKLVQIGGPKRPWRSVVGVVGNVRQEGLDQPERMQLYVPERQWPFPDSDMVLAISTNNNPEAIARPAREAIWSVNRNVRITEVAPMDQVIGASLAQRRFPLLLLGLFAVAALLLAALGLYGLMTYTVTQRTMEIGVRMALGAQPLEVLRLVLRQGMSLVGIGVAAGLAGAITLRSLISGLLFEVKAWDPATLISVALVLIVVALLACYIPARRATKVDPLVALRYE